MLSTPIYFYARHLSAGLRTIQTCVCSSASELKMSATIIGELPIIDWIERITASRDQWRIRSSASDRTYIVDNLFRGQIYLPIVVYELSLCRFASLRHRESRLRIESRQQYTTPLRRLSATRFPPVLRQESWRQPLLDFFAKLRSRSANGSRNSSTRSLWPVNKNWSAAAAAAPMRRCGEVSRTLLMLRLLPSLWQYCGGHYSGLQQPQHAANRHDRLGGA